jgi:GGDEF domain-containing protein
MQVDEKWVGIAILRDVTDRKLQEAELERMALHDALTGLPNRTLLNDRIESAIRSAQHTDDQMAVLLLDLDRFKDVNDTLGHHVGDLLLTEVGPRLQQPLRSSDTVARLGGARSCCSGRPTSRLRAGRPSASSRRCAGRSRSRT